MDASAAPELLPARVLVADDDDPMRQILAAFLRRQGYQVTCAADGHQMKRELDAVDGDVPPPDLIITDLRMPGWSGLHVLERVQRSLPSTPVILITAFGDEQTHQRAEDLGAAAVFDKPFDLKQLLEAVQLVLDR